MHVIINQWLIPISQGLHYWAVLWQKSMWSPCVPVLNLHSILWKQRIQREVAKLRCKCSKERKSDEARSKLWLNLECVLEELTGGRWPKCSLGWHTHGPGVQWRRTYTTTQWRKGKKIFPEEFILTKSSCSRKSWRHFQTQSVTIQWGSEKMVTPYCKWWHQEGVCTIHKFY